MTFETDAIYSNGAFVPVTPVSIPEGVRFHLRINEEEDVRVTTNGTPCRAELDEFLRLAAELPVESPDDGFSGADHDRILYGEP